MKDNRKKRRRFSRDYKISLIRELESGKSMAQVSREHEIHEAQIYNWQAEYRAAPSDAFTKRRKKHADDERIAQLEKTIGRLYVENDILKKASAFLEERLQRVKEEEMS